MTKAEPTPLTATGKAAVLGGATLAALASGTIAVVLPAIADAFGNGHNGVQIKTVATALGLGSLIGAPLGGLLTDRIGRRPTLTLAAAIFGLFGCAIMFADQLWQIIAARFIVGLATGAMGVGMAAVIGDHFEGHQRSRWLGINSAVATFVMMGANPLTGALADRSWRYGFSLYALAFPVLLAIFVGIPRREAAPAEIQTGGAEPRGVSGLSVSALVLSVMVGALATGTSLYWPFRFRELGVASAKDMAIYAIPNALMVGVAALLYSRVRAVLSLKQVFILGAVASCIALTAMGLAPAPWAIIAGLAVEGFAIGLLTPNLTNFALTVSPPAWRGRNLGLVKAALYGSPFFIQFLLEPLNKLGGAAFALWGIATIAAVFSLAVLTGLLGRTPQAATPA
jgi:MFS family permease